MSRNPAAEYGDTYFLVVRCERKWSPDEFAQQRFALVVEMSHSEDIALYERVREPRGRKSSGVAVFLLP